MYMSFGLPKQQQGKMLRSAYEETAHEGIKAISHREAKCKGDPSSIQWAKSGVLDKSSMKDHIPLLYEFS